VLSPTPQELEAAADGLLKEAADKEAAERDPVVKPKKPKRRVHRKHLTKKCARPGCKGYLPPNREPGSKLYGSDLCTPCGKERYKAMVKSREAQAYWREWCAKEYSAASMVSEHATLRRANRKVMDAKRLSGARERSRGATAPEPQESYSDEEVAELMSMTPEQLKKRLQEEGYSDEEIADLLHEQKKLR